MRTELKNRREEYKVEQVEGKEGGSKQKIYEDQKVRKLKRKPISIKSDKQSRYPLKQSGSLET